MELKNGIIFQLVCPEKQQEGRSQLQYIPWRCSDGKCQADVQRKDSLRFCDESQFIPSDFVGKT